MFHGWCNLLLEKYMFVSHTRHTQQKINRSTSFAIDNKILEYKNKRVYLGAMKFKTKD